MSCANGTLGDCYAAAWVKRVLDNDGARPSDNTIAAAVTFYNALETAGIVSKMKVINFIAPDSLIAARTPFFRRSSFDPWTDISTTPFVAGNLTVNGLIGTSGWASALNTGFTPSTGFASWTNCGITVNTVTDPGAGVTYVHFSSNNGVVTHGIWDSAGTKYGYPSGAGVTKAAHTFPGYYSANRRANNDCYLYYATGATAHASIASDLVVRASALPGQPTYFLALNNNGAKSDYSISRISFVAQHEGLTAAESLAFFNAMQALRVSLGGGFVPDPTSPEQLAVDWASRVVANGGAMPSATSINAAETFLTSLFSAGLMSKMVAINIIAPDSLTAAITPLFRGPGLDPWTNNNFLAADLTVNGLIGNGSTKYLATGITPSTAFLNDTSAGMTVYTHTSQADANTCELGALSPNPANGHFALSVSWGDANAYLLCYGGTIGYVAGANSAWTGYVSGNRVAASGAGASTLYRARSDSPHAAFGTSANAIDQTRTSQSLLAFCRKSNLGNPELYTSKRLSFMAVHLGLTATESSDLYNAVQALRTTLGGGFV